MARVRKNEVDDEYGDDAAPGAGHNLVHDKAARAERIRIGFAEIFEAEMEIAVQEEGIMQPLKKERTKLWRNLKKDVDITRKVLDLEYRQFKLAKLAAEDEEDGTLDDMREVFEALHPGSTVDWVSVVEGRQEAAE